MALRCGVPVFTFQRDKHKLVATREGDNTDSWQDHLAGMERAVGVGGRQRLGERVRDRQKRVILLKVS